MSNTTTNVDIDYIQRDYHSIVDATITFANINFGQGTSANRLWTNFNADSFSRNWLEILAYVADALYFYFDNQATQTYLQTATVRSAIRNIAKQFGFTPASATSATGVVQITTTGSASIPRGRRLQATNGATFFTTQIASIGSAGTISVPVIQGTEVTETLIATGLQNEEFLLRGPNVIVDKSNIVAEDITPRVSVNGNSYSLVDSLIRHNGTDSPAVVDSLGNIIGGGGRVYLLDEKPDGTPFIRFGDGIFGRKLQPGESLNVIYRSGGGSFGNIPEETLTTLLDSITNVASVTNAAEFSGGADEQSVEQLRQLIPASLRTLDRAVAEQDYSDILVANFSEVFAASTEANRVDPGIDLNIYVVPQGTGIPKISDNLLLKSRLSKYIDRRKMVTIQFQILDAFGVDSLITLEVFINDTASKSTVSESIKTALLEFFSLTTGGPSGIGVKFAEPILLKDITNIVEAIPGIIRFEIKRLTYRPRVQKNIVGLLTDYNVSDVTIYNNVEEREWLLAASGIQTETSGTVLFANNSSTGFTYDSGTGVVNYLFPVDLSKVAPGDQFRDGAGTDFSILAVDSANSSVTISESQTVNTTPAPNVGGSIRNGATEFESYKVFKKILASASNLSADTITDGELDLTILEGSAVALSARVLLDNFNVFKLNQYATGEYYLVDAESNVWEILSNDSNTLRLSISSVNDAGITSVVPGNYKIVPKLTGNQITFSNSVFNIQYNTQNTFYSDSAQFNQIGTIGDSFTISIQQTNVGRLGRLVDPVSYDSGTKIIRLNSSPDLSGISSEDVFIDNEDQIFNIVGVDNTAKPSTSYLVSNFDTEYILKGMLKGSQVAMGFQVPTSDIYAVVSFYLKAQGNIVGNLIAKIVDDDSGLPDLSSVVATSLPVNVATISQNNFQKVFFSFNTPPNLTASTQYHLVLSPDTGYVNSQQDGLIPFDNIGLVSFVYSNITGTVQYSASVDLSSVEPGNYFKDSSGNLFKILEVDDAANTVTLNTGLIGVDTSAPGSSDDGSIIVLDTVLVGLDTSAPTYASGEFSEFDGTVSWSNSTQGPDAGNLGSVSTPSTFSAGDAIFTVEGTKSITIDSNLTPALGPNATISRRYYDDDQELSLVLGHSKGTITKAVNVNPLGIGTVDSVPNRRVDNFVFRTSRFSDDVVNLRLNEIPQLKEEDISIQIFGGID
jgi:hypothetical protein